MPRVSETKLGAKAHVGLMVDKAIYIMLKGLAQENGVSIKFVLRRLIENAVSTREIPWPGGSKVPVPATPIYDAETEEPLAPPVQAGRKTPASRAQ
jgi:hypothetical protein